jgi:hypothetical protein
VQKFVAKKGGIFGSCIMGGTKVPVCNEFCSRGRFLDGVEAQRGGAPMTWGEIGQLMSGTGVLITSLCAGVTVTIISLYQKRKQWVDDFRALYAEFWNDKDISQVRRWIVSNKLYNEVLKPVLTQRIEKGYNDLDEDGSIKIDMIDKFMSLIIQLETLEESTRTKRHRALIEKFLFSKHWKEKVRSRPELREYIATSWKGEIEML